jgi:DMSO/TMAO reductase YedYZ molybdopterin-dependent catalytic subunit
MPDWKKLIEAKIALAKKGNKPSKASPNERIPAGQKLVTNFPVLDLGIRPDVSTANWTLRVYGLVENELNLDWALFANYRRLRTPPIFIVSRAGLCWMWNGRV